MALPGASRLLLGPSWRNGDPKEAQNSSKTVPKSDPFLDVFFKGSWRVFWSFRGDFRLIFKAFWGPRRRESMVFLLENNTFSRCSFLASWSSRGPFRAPLGSSWVHLGPKWGPKGGPKLVQSGLGRGPKMDPKIDHFLEQF